MLRRAAARRRAREQLVRRRGDRRRRRSAARARRSRRAARADAVLLGAVGGPRWDGGDVRPEQGLIRLRRELDVYANLRPARRRPESTSSIVRELVGGLYYGRRGVLEDGTVFDTCEYHPAQVERDRAARVRARAEPAPRRVLSVDKANVLDTSRMWRRVVAEVAADVPRRRAPARARRQRRDATRDALRRASTSLVTENTFGDILSDVAAGGHRRPRARRVGEPRRRPAPGSSSRSTDPRPTSPAPASRTRRRCSARSRSCSSTRLGRRGLARAVDGPWSARSPRRRRAISAASRRRPSSATPCSASLASR